MLEGKQIKFNKKYDLDNDYQEIVQCVGKSKADKLIKGYSGEWVYFSSIKKALKSQIHRVIRMEFNGFNYTQLAVKYGYTERSIRNIVKKEAMEN